MIREFFSLFNLAIWQRNHSTKEREEIVLYCEAELLVSRVLENGLLVIKLFIIVLLHQEIILFYQFQVENPSGV